MSNYVVTSDDRERMEEWTSEDPLVVPIGGSFTEVESKYNDLNDGRGIDSTERTLLVLFMEIVGTMPIGTEIQVYPNVALFGDMDSFVYTTTQEYTDEIATIEIENDGLSYSDFIRVTYRFIQSGSEYTVNALTGIVKKKTADPVETFLDLSDVDEPDYSGHANEIIKVNPGETGLVFASSTVGVDTQDSGAPVDTPAATINFNNGLAATGGAGTTQIDVEYGSTVEDVEAASNAGSATSLSRSDHVHKGRDIYTDTDIYVDGDSGSDSNSWKDATGWGTAKQTLTFLDMDDSDALPRGIYANVTIYVRGTVLSQGSVFHTQVNGFVGPGTLKIVGETTDVQTGIDVTGRDNVSTSMTYRSYIEASAESWTTNEHRGRFIVVTAGTGSGSTLYPILSNTATRLESYALPSLSLTTSVFKIVSVTQLKGATVADPGTLVSYTGYKPFYFYGNQCPIELEKLDFTNVINEHQTFQADRCDYFIARNLSSAQWFQFYFAGRYYIERCAIDLPGGVWFSTNNGSIVHSSWNVIFANDSAGGGTYAQDAAFYSFQNRWEGHSTAFWSNVNSEFYAYGINLVKDCTIGLQGISADIQLVNWGATVQYWNFIDTTTAINLAGARYLVGNSTQFQGSGVTTEVKVSDTVGDTATFADLNAQNPIANAKTGSFVSYMDTNSPWAPIQAPEYDNTTSGLSTINYQDAIDEIYAEKAAASGLASLDGSSYLVQTSLATKTELSHLSGATYDAVQDFINTFIGPAVISGGLITDSGSGQIDVAAGTGIAKVTDTEIADTKMFDWSSETDLSLTDNSINYVYIDYNGGSPQVFIETVGAYFWVRDHVYVGSVYREGTTLHISNVGSQFTNFNSRVIRKSFEIHNGAVQRATGIKIGSTNRYVEITSGAFWAGHSRRDFPAYDTDPGGGADTFSYWYNDGSWQEVTAQSQISNTQYNDYGVGLAALTPNQYGVHWVYADLDGTHLHVVYGVDSYAAAAALAAQPPVNLPNIVANYGFLVGKVIIEQNATTMDTYSPYDVAFAGSGVPDHNELTGLQGGTTDEYYHLTSTQYAALGPNINDTYDNFGSNPATVVVDGTEGQGDLKFGLSETNSLVVDLSGITNVDTDGLLIENGNDFLRIKRHGIDAIDVDAEFDTLDITCNGTFTLGGGAGSSIIAAGNISISNIFSGGISLNATADLNFDDQHLSSAIPLSESGITGLATDFTTISVIGAINEGRGVTTQNGGAGVDSPARTINFVNGVTATGGSGTTSVNVDYGASAADVGSSGAAGSATSVSRSDHVHRGVASFRKSGDTLLYGAVTLSEGAGITLTQSGQDIAIASSLGVFGSDYYKNESLSESSTTSETFQQKLRLTTGSLSAGDYYLAWSYMWRHDSTTSDFKSRVQVDDTTTFAQVQQEINDSGTDQAHPASGFAIVTLTSGAKNIDLDYCTSDNANESFIWDARLVIWRVS